MILHDPSEIILIIINADNSCAGYYTCEDSNFLLKSWKQPSFYIYISDPNFWTVVYMVIPWYFL